MTLIRFPDPRYAGYEGIVTIGGDLNPTNLLRAYSQGIFPWPIEGWPLTWFCPEERAILEFKDLHVPRSLARVSRRSPFTFTIDHDFRAVITSCATAARPEGEGTWITPQMIRGYCELHRMGYAHSVEAWEEGELVGGVYGIDAGGAFAGESMFYARPSASKLALLHLIEHLQERGSEWMDIQVMTPHMRALGAKLISRDLFLRMLVKAQERGLKLF
ncbi:MAG TPA: leucyl/phenylalanyl-tRNA--protein transferase [Pyrinomonadaceae bacterium]|nr:leucyl/phenylalanyl-tRNA--protein transferase [Pyrinomonadaceae bacterium]